MTLWTNLTSSPADLLIPSPFLAAATDKSSRLFAETLPWLLLLLGVVIVGGAIIFVARRYVRDADQGSQGGFTLHDLRELRKAGTISEEEFIRAKAQMIGRIAADKPANPDGQAGTPPGNPPDSQV